MPLSRLISYSSKRAADPKTEDPFYVVVKCAGLGDHTHSLSFARRVEAPGPSLRTSRRPEPYALEFSIRHAGAFLQGPSQSPNRFA